MRIGLADRRTTPPQVAAIDGGDFEAYGSLPLRNPNHTMITRGGFAFKGDVGDVFWFVAKNCGSIDRIRLKIEG